MILTLTKNHDTAQQGGRGRAGGVTSGGRQAGALAESRASGRQEAQERAAGRAVAIAARVRTVASGRTDGRYASGEPARPPACLMRVASQRAPARPAVLWCAFAVLRPCTWLFAPLPISVPLVYQYAILR